MKRLGLAVFLTSALSAPAGAQPAPPASDAPFTCIFEGVSADQRATAGSAASQRLTDAPPDGEQRGGAVLNMILTALPACAAAGRWTEAQQELAEQYVLAQLAREHMRRHYAAQNVDLAFLDEAVAGARGGMLSFDELVGRLRAQGVTDNRPDSAGDIVYLYLELAGQAEAVRNGFSNPSLQRR